MTTTCNGDTDRQERGRDSTPANLPTPPPVAVPHNLDTNTPHDDNRASRAARARRAARVTRAPLQTRPQKPRLAAAASNGIPQVRHAIAWGPAWTRVMAARAYRGCGCKTMWIPQLALDESIARPAIPNRCAKRIVYLRHMVFERFCRVEYSYPLAVNSRRHNKKRHMALIAQMLVELMGNSQPLGSNVCRARAFGGMSMRQHANVGRAQRVASSGRLVANRAPSIAKGCAVSPSRARANRPDVNVRAGHARQGGQRANASGDGGLMTAGPTIT